MYRLRSELFVFLRLLQLDVSPGFRNVRSKVRLRRVLHDPVAVLVFVHLAQLLYWTDLVPLVSLGQVLVPVVHQRYVILHLFRFLFLHLGEQIQLVGAIFGHVRCNGALLDCFS
uniref:(northern house mosquito) hypothetical protein n=1 Tax=Culex pipiens TaxID=7175 RepID=A0A8D8FXK9_CULPI